MDTRAELKDISNFVRIARAGSLSKATRETNLPKATLSHSLRRLEDCLRVELFLRSASGLSLTDAGQAYLEQAKRIFESCDAAEAAAQRAHSTIGGRIRLAASAEFGTSILGAATLYLAREHPELDFDIRMYPSDVLLTDQLDYDALIFVGTPPDSGLISRKIGAVSYRLFASQNYLDNYGEPKTPKDVAVLPGVQYTRGGIPEPWRVCRGDRVTDISFAQRFYVNDYWMSKFYCVSGAALAYLPDFFVHYELDQGALLNILPDYSSKEISAQVLYPASRHKNPRVKRVVDTLRTRFTDILLHPGYSLIDIRNDQKS